jgi:hypothetical protein
LIIELTIGFSKSIFNLLFVKHVNHLHEKRGDTIGLILRSLFCRSAEHPFNGLTKSLSSRKLLIEVKYIASLCLCNLFPIHHCH